MTDEQLLDKVGEIEGWLHPHQAQTLINIAKEYIKPYSVAVELGVWKGKSLYIWAQYAKKNDALVIGVDTFNGIPKDVEDNTLYYSEAEDPVTFKKRYAGEICKDLPVILYQGTTTEAAEHMQNLSFNLCFVDADHSFEGVSEDIVNWLPRIKSGGMMCGHDYDNENVYRAVNELLPNHTVQNNIWMNIV